MDIWENILIAYVHHFYSAKSFKLLPSVFLSLNELHEHCELWLCYGYLKTLPCIFERVCHSGQAVAYPGINI